jgi:Rieske Fe-S protein
MTERREPRWKADFPIDWDADQYVARRELAKFMTLGSGLLALASGAIALVARFRKNPALPRVRITSSSSLAVGSSLFFRYPTDEDPCVLVRGRDGGVRAFSQVCTHLSCAVVHRPAEDRLICPCHNGSFSDLDGRPLAGPPTRRLPLIHLEVRGDDIYAVDKEL